MDGVDGRRLKRSRRGIGWPDEAILVIENPATVPSRSLVAIGSNCDVLIVILFSSDRSSAASVASSGSCCWPVAWDWRPTWPSCWCSDSSCPAPKWISASARPRRGSSVSHRSVSSLDPVRFADAIDGRPANKRSGRCCTRWGPAARLMARPTDLTKRKHVSANNKRSRSTDSANRSRDERS